jgi:hypothetical protein
MVIDIKLRPNLTGLTLRGRFFNADNSPASDFFTGGFHEIAGGSYALVAEPPEGFTEGWVSVYNDATGAYLTDSKLNPLPAGGGGGTATQGPGADPCTIQITDGNDPPNPVVGALVWITDAPGGPTIAGALPTDSAGNRTFLLNHGQTYYLWMTVPSDAPGPFVQAILARPFVAERD